MSIRTKEQTPYGQGWADYKIGAQCPFEEGSNDAQEWELGYMDARRCGTRGTQGIGGEPISHISHVELQHATRPVSRAV